MSDTTDPHRLRLGQFNLRLASSSQDITQAQALRALCFGLSSKDVDPFDDIYSHGLIFDAAQNLCACFRYKIFTPSQIKHSYSAQHYDISALARFPAPILEMGRFCVHPAAKHPDIIRAALAHLTQTVDQNAVGLLCGCSSFKGRDPKPYEATFAHLHARHRAPRRWAPKQKSAQIIHLDTAPEAAPSPINPLTRIPALLRSYLMIGGWVSDHAVVDPLLDTLHVFTGVEIAQIPPARQRVLRAMLESQNS